MKKLVLLMVFGLLVFGLGGCDFFGTPYDKMMNVFEAEIIDENAIDISITTTVDYGDNSYNLDPMTTAVFMTYFVNEKEVAVIASLDTVTLDVYLAQKGDTMLAYIQDRNRLYPVEMDELEDAIPFDSTIFNLADYTGKAEWESKFEEVEEGVFKTEVSLETLFDDEMFQDIEESFTSVGATVESLVGKMAELTVSYDATTKSLTMIFDLESFDVTMNDETLSIKLDEEIVISKSTKEPINYQEYHTYPVTNIDHINRTYQLNEDIEGDLYDGQFGYFKFHLTPGNYMVTIKDNQGFFDLAFYNSSLTMIERNQSGSITLTTEGDYYLKVTGRDNFGYFIIALAGTSF